MAVPLQQVGPMHAQAVYGLNIQDHRLAVLTKRVLTLALIQAIWLIVATVFNFAITPQAEHHILLVGLAVAGSLAIPACGYFGAKKNHEALTCCFCGCNIANSILGIFGIGSMWLGLAFATQVVVQECEDLDPQKASTFIDVAGACYGKTVEACCKLLPEMMKNARNAAIFATILAPFSVVLQCSSFWFGKQLYDAIKAGQVVNSAPRQPVMASVAVQPRAY